MMAKISSILPSNKRITSTDVANERPVRPGVPSFGQPIAETANPRNEYRKITVSDDELSVGNYGPDARISEGQDKTKRDIQLIDQVNSNFDASLDVRV